MIGLTEDVETVIGVVLILILYLQDLLEMFGQTKDVETVIWSSINIGVIFVGPVGNVWTDKRC